MKRLIEEYRDRKVNEYCEKFNDLADSIDEKVLEFGYSYEKTLEYQCKTVILEWYKWQVTILSSYELDIEEDEED